MSEFILTGLGAIIAPSIFRIVSIDSKPEGKMFRMTASLYHATYSLDVTWTSDKPLDSNFRPGLLASPKGFPDYARPNALNHIRYLKLVDSTACIGNLFATVPESWVSDRPLVGRACALWDGLPGDFQQLFNTIFLNAARFQKFCQGPSSTHGHHSEVNGNLRHTIEVAEAVQRDLKLFARADAGVAIMAALLHDAGKVDEYIESQNGYELSLRGKLLGHKITVTEWVAVARSQLNGKIPEPHYLSLMHALTATPDRTDYSGLRPRVTPESELVALADCGSGKADLHNQCGSDKGGWGKTHPHLRGAPYTVPERPVPLRGLAAVAQRVKERTRDGHAQM